MSDSKHVTYEDAGVETAEGGRAVDAIKQMVKDTNRPEVIWPCFYGIDTDVQSQLISANKTVDEICEYIGADSLAFLSVEGLLKVMPKGGYCDACFTGRYPVAIPESFGRDKFMEGFKPRNLDKPLYFDDDAVVEKYDDRSWEEEHGEA